MLFVESTGYVVVVNEILVREYVTKCNVVLLVYVNSISKQWILDV